MLWHELAARWGPQGVKAWSPEQPETSAIVHVEAAQRMAFDQEERFVRLRHGGVHSRAWFCEAVDDAMRLEAIVGKQAASKAEKQAAAAAAANSSSSRAGSGTPKRSAAGAGTASSASGTSSSSRPQRSASTSSVPGQGSSDPSAAGADGGAAGTSFAGVAAPADKSKRSPGYKAAQALLQPEPSVPWAPDVDSCRSRTAWHTEPLPLLPGARQPQAPMDGAQAAAGSGEQAGSSQQAAAGAAYGAS